MTEALANGELTRAQRHAYVQQMLEEIDRIEKTNQARVEMQTMHALEYGDARGHEAARARSATPLRRRPQ